MPNFCEICRTVSTKENISYFHVPKDEGKRQRWVESSGVDFKVNSRVCQKHFDENDILNEGINGKNWRRLKTSALPRSEEIHSIATQATEPHAYLCNVGDNEVSEDEEFEILIQDLQFDDHHKRKCGEIVLDSYDTFTLNCSLCSLIYLDLVTFSEHVRKLHTNLFPQSINIEHELDDEEEIFEDESTNINTTNVEGDYDSSDNKPENFKVEFDYASNESNADSMTEYKIEIDYSDEIDFKNEAVVAYFIKLLKQKPFIWSTEFAYGKRKKGLISLIDPLSKKFPSLTFTYKKLLTLLRAIRVAYDNELKQIKSTNDRGIKYTPKLWFFDKLSFVENLKENAVSIQRKIDCLKKTAVELPLNIHEKSTDESDMITLEIINHYKEQPFLWNIFHPEYRGKFLVRKFYEFLRPKYAQIAKLTETQFKKELEKMLKWYSATEDIRLHMKKLDQPFNSYYPSIYKALEFLRGNVAPFCCDTCNKVFYVENKYLLHKRFCGVVVHECKQCLMRFPNSTNLNIHMSTHSNERPFSCTICGLTFRANILLNRHIHRHKAKEFKCDICQRTYRYAYLLRTHQKSHLGIRDYVCHVCGKTFTSSKYLYNHRLGHFKENNRKCNNCGKELKACSMPTHKKNCMNRVLKKVSNKKPAKPSSERNDKQDCEAKQSLLKQIKNVPH